MIDTLLQPEAAPFTVALCLMLVIAVVELLGTLMGLAPSGLLDSLLPETDLDLDGDVEFDASGGSALEGDIVTAPDAPSAGPLSQVLGWLCVGRVPILVLLVCFLTAFGLTGLIVQGLVAGLMGFTLPALLAVIPALIVALPATRHLGLALSALMPKEQTEAVSQRGFVGRIATIIRGEARTGQPAEAKLSDQYGQTHYLLVEPDEADAVLMAGQEVLIVRLVSGRYHAIDNPNPALTDHE